MQSKVYLDEYHLYLGHKAYVKGTPGFEKVVEAFGEEIIGEDGEINRRTLGAKVFADKVKKLFFQLSVKSTFFKGKNLRHLACHKLINGHLFQGSSLRSE